MTAKPVHPVDEFANPQGRPDKFITENEAALWLLTTVERRHGYRVRLDEATERWIVVKPEGAA